MLGGNDITDEHIICHVMNLEAVNIYESKQNLKAMKKALKPQQQLHVPATRCQQSANYWPSVTGLLDKFNFTV